MIEHYLSNKNESATILKFQLSPQLNTGLYNHIMRADVYITAQIGTGNIAPTSLTPLRHPDAAA